jgi:hypothetical protein
MAHGARLLIWHVHQLGPDLALPCAVDPPSAERGGSGASPLRTDPKASRPRRQLRSRSARLAWVDGAREAAPPSRSRKRSGGTKSCPLSVRPAGPPGGRRPEHSAEPARSRRVSGALMGSYCGTFPAVTREKGPFLILDTAPELHGRYWIDQVTLFGVTSSLAVIRCRPAPAGVGCPGPTGWMLPPGGTGGRRVC